MLIFSFFSLLLIYKHFEADLLYLLTIVAFYSLFPLLFTSELKLPQLFMYLSHIILGLYAFNINKIKLNYSFYHKTYLSGFCVLFAYENIIQYILGMDTKLPFLPLMLTSVYCSFGIIFTWLKFYFNFMLLDCV